MRIRLLISILFLSFTLEGKASEQVIRTPGHEPRIVVDSTSEWKGVLMAAGNLAEDFRRVCGTLPLIRTNPDASSHSIIIGTLGKSPSIRRVLDDEDIASLEGKREKYIIKATEDGKTVIAGSDKRGTTYGIYALSQMIGVSPWYWWADVPAASTLGKDTPIGNVTISIEKGIHSEGEPEVEYRGIFLNDEWPALTEWVKEKYGSYNHEFYLRVFELLLRLKGNFLWPAMWDAAFYDDDPLNSYYADMMGIIMGTSHHEPCARAQKEWHRYGSGPWDYQKNKAALDSFWAKGLERMAPTEDIVTVGMRGDGDEPMTEGENIALLEEIVRNQRELISKHTGRKVEEVPQVWALYKEVQAYYDKGMTVPSDVTLLFCDDNWGNCRWLPTKEDAARSGGCGMYYHFDYVGGPRCYRWINTIDTHKVKREMDKCLESGIRKIWIVNVGDLKPMEYPIQFFLDMAWDPEGIDVEKHARLFAEKTFGKAMGERIGNVLLRYGTLASRITPEMLYSDSYDAAGWTTVLKEWQNLDTESQKITDTLSQISLPWAEAYRQIVGFEIEAFRNLHRMYYSLFLGDQDGVDMYFQRDRDLMHYYNKILSGGKWNHMMDQPHIGYTSWQMPDKDIKPTVLQ